MPAPSPISGSQAIGVFVVVVIVLAAVIYLPAIVRPPRERAAASSSDSFCPGGCPAAEKQTRAGAEAFGGPDPGVRAAPRVLPPAIALPIAGSQNWCGGNVVTPQRESRSASGPVREIALEFSDGW